MLATCWRPLLNLTDAALGDLSDGFSHLDFDSPVPGPQGLRPDGNADQRPAFSAARSVRLGPGFISPPANQCLSALKKPACSTYRVDPYLTSMDQALTVALSVPGLLGGTDTGPKTYLILIENEDELRPTGGFVTAVGKAVVWNGQLINLSIEDSYAVDDINKAYPAAPWQMQSFMNIPIMVFRDTSWFTDYPTAVRWAEYLYAYTNDNSVNGVIAIDQHVLETLLSVTGPVYVSQIATTVTADNLRTVMRAQKVPPPPISVTQTGTASNS